MKIAGDPPALRLGAVDRPLEERRTVVAGPLEAKCEAPAQWHLDDKQEHEPRDQGRKDPTPDPLLVGFDDAVELIGLEEELGPIGGAYRQIDLDQAAERSLEAVLRPAEVAHLGLRMAAGERCLLVIAEREGLSDQRGRVG